jgi:uncharacterized protein (TIGR04255 family)
VRFIPETPFEAVFGMIYPIILKKYPDLKLVPLPLSQVPQIARSNDPNLKYQPLYRLQNGNINITIGSQVIAFSVSKPYMGWTQWKSAILGILNEISNRKIIKTVERTGLRYINFLEQNVYDVINADIRIINSQVKCTSTTIRTEIPDSEYVKALQLANNASVGKPEQNKRGSIIDIDVSRNKILTCKDFTFNLETILEKSHSLEKHLFYDLLTDDFIKTLGPKYEEDRK